MNKTTYFDETADKYTEMMGQGVLGRIKTKEVMCVVRLLQPEKNEMILDAGCGSGHYSLAIREAGADVFAVDLSPKMVEEVKKLGIAAEVHDLEELNLDKKFDKIVCAGALEFCTDVQKVLNNLKTHLKPGGIIVILFPKFSLSTILYKFYHLSHRVTIQLFTLKKMEKMLETAEFTAVEREKPSILACVIKAKSV